MDQSGGSCINRYGDGRAARRIVEIVLGVEVS